MLPSTHHLGAKMISSKTVFVIGAGASSEVGLPLGTRLAEQISELLNYRFEFSRLEHGDATFLEALRTHIKNHELANEHLVLARQISEGIRLVASIDNYIDTHRHDPRIALLGKAAIAYLILKAEKSSTLHFDTRGGRTRLPFSSYESTWLLRFGRQLVDGVPHERLDTIFDNLTIVCFNYDRCVEEFLAHYLAGVYSIEMFRARDLVDRLRIMRPYGGLGPLRPKDQLKGVPFAYDSFSSVFQLGQGLRTYTEQIGDDKLLSEIRSALSDAETIVFLGFAFHRQNLKLIRPETPLTARRLFASAFGFSDTDRGSIASRMAGLFSHQPAKRSAAKQKPEIHVRTDLKCAGLFDEYKWSMFSPS